MIKDVMILITVTMFSLSCASDVDSNGIKENDENRMQEMEGESMYFPLPESLSDPITTEQQVFHLQKVVEGLEIPWGMTFLPDGRMLITERKGEIYMVENGQLNSTPLDNVPEVHAQGQGGLLDINIHPDYEENGWIYITYSRPVGDGANTALARMKLEGHAFTDVEELFVASPGFSRNSHFGSRIVFDDEGYVYFSIGDRRENDHAQDLSTHTASVFRLHDDGSVPDDNPFTDVASAQPEIFTYGHRNIQGMDVHPVTGEIWAHEHGPKGGDEVNIIRAGNNYGWPVITYGVNYDGSVISPDTAREGMEQPVLHWTPSIAPSGLAFVTGSAYPGWTNNMMAGSLVMQYLNRVELNGEEVVAQEELLKDMGRVRNVRMGSDGYLYVAFERPGIIYRLLPVD